MACAAVIGLEGSRIVTQRADVIADARLDTANLTSSLIQHAELTFQTADAILISIVDRLEHETPNAAERLRLKALFAVEVSHSPQFISFAVIDSDGAMIVSTFGEAGAGQFSDREYFSYHRANNNDELHIGAPIRGRKAEGWIIPVSRRFNKPDGTFGGVAVATINPRYFQDAYDRLELGQNSAVILVSTSGTLLVRRPFVEANVGRDMTNSVIFAQLKQAPKGSLEIKASIDGVSRFNSYERGHTYPIFVAVAQNMDELLAPWRASTERRLIEVAVLSAFILVMGAFVWRAARGLAEHSTKLRETNDRFDAALANMPTGLSMFDADGRLMVWNERYVELYGMSPEVVRRGADIHDIVAHRKQTSGLDMDARAYVNEFRNDLLRDGRSVKISRLDDGRVMSVTNTAIAGGGWIAIHENITERVGDEEALFNQAAELARINMQFDTALSNMTQGLSHVRRATSGWWSGTSAMRNCTKCPRNCLKSERPTRRSSPIASPAASSRADTSPEAVKAKIAALSSLASGFAPGRRIGRRPLHAGDAAADAGRRLARHPRRHHRAAARGGRDRSSGSA